MVCFAHGGAPTAPTPSDQCIVKLSSVQSLLVVCPWRRWHAAVGIQQDPNAADQQKQQEQHKEADKAQRRPLLRVSRHRLQHRRVPGEPGWGGRGEIIVHNPVVWVAHGGSGLRRVERFGDGLLQGGHEAVVEPADHIVQSGKTSPPALPANLLARDAILQKRHGPN